MAELQLHPLFQLRTEQAKAKSEGERLKRQTAIVTDQQTRLAQDVADMEAVEKTFRSGVEAYGSKEDDLADLRLDLADTCDTLLAETKRKLSHSSPQKLDDLMSHITKEVEAAKSHADTFKEKLKNAARETARHSEQLKAIQATFDEIKNRAKTIGDTLAKLATTRDDARNAIAKDPREAYVRLKSLKTRIEEVSVDKSGYLDAQFAAATTTLLEAKKAWHDAVKKEKEIELDATSAAEDYQLKSTGQLDKMIAAARMLDDPKMKKEQSAQQSPANETSPSGQKS